LWRSHGWGSRTRGKKKGRLIQACKGKKVEFGSHSPKFGSGRYGEGGRLKKGGEGSWNGKGRLVEKKKYIEFLKIFSFIVPKK